MLLTIPLSFSFSIIKKQRLESHTTIIGLFGLVKIQTHFPHRVQSKKKPAAITSKVKRNAKQARKTHNRQGLALITQPVFRRHIMKFIKRMITATHAKNIYLCCRLGLSDPADTGRLWSVIGPLSGLVKNLQSMTIKIEPEFINEGIEIESHGNFRLVPLQLITIILAFIFSATTLRAWQTLRQEH